MQSVVDVDLEVLLEALNDGEKAQELMAQRGWTEHDLLVRAEALSKALIDTMSAVNIV